MENMENKPLKTIEELLEETKWEDLAELAASLPIYPPLKPGGEVTVREMCSDLTEEELDYVMSKYTGSMERG